MGVANKGGSLQRVKKPAQTLPRSLKTWNRKIIKGSDWTKLGNKYCEPSFGGESREKKAKEGRPRGTDGGAEGGGFEASGWIRKRVIKVKLDRANVNH